VAGDGRYGQVVLDTPPTRQALDFLEAPKRIIGFLDSGALRVALKPWFDEEGRLRAASRWGVLGRRAERFLDEVVGMDLLRDMAEFFQAFGPLFEGFRKRALEVEELLRSKQTLFVLVTGPGEERIPDTLFFARHLEEAGYNLGPIVVNRVHPMFLVEGAPPVSGDPCRPTGWELLTWAGQRDRRGLVELAKLLSREQPLVDLPLLPDEPTDLPSLEAMGRQLEGRLAEWERYVSRTS
jgi:anion-transporting  ArsA/GET3 family ATPase